MRPRARRQAWRSHPAAVDFRSGMGNGHAGGRTADQLPCEENRGGTTTPGDERQVQGHQPSLSKVRKTLLVSPGLSLPSMAVPPRANHCRRPGSLTSRNRAVPGQIDLGEKTIAVGPRRPFLRYSLSLHCRQACGAFVFLPPATPIRYNAATFGIGYESVRDFPTSGPHLIPRPGRFGWQALGWQRPIRGLLREGTPSVLGGAVRPRPHRRQRGRPRGEMPGYREVQSRCC